MRKRPRDIQLTSSQHHCTRGRHFFAADMCDRAAPKARSTHRVVALAGRIALDMFHDVQVSSREQRTKTLHHARRR